MEAETKKQLLSATNSKPSREDKLITAATSTKTLPSYYPLHNIPSVCFMLHKCKIINYFQSCYKILILRFVPVSA